ncbi:MAG: DUF6663 family protein [Halapricum sp.]
MDDEREVRVLPGPEKGTLRLLDRETYEPIVVDTDDGAAGAADLQPGYLLDTRLDWSDPDPVLEAFMLHRPTLYAFADGIDPVFELAQDVWQVAKANGDGMNSRVTRNTDGEVNGVCYVFAENSMDDLFEEFRTGARPLEPLVDRINEREDPAPREVFVLRPEGGEFVIVTIALQKNGHFAETLRETYEREYVAEPLA